MAKPCAYFSETFLCYFDAYQKTIRNERTKEEYRRNVAILCNFAQKDFLELTEEDIDAFFSYLRKRVAEGSLKKTTINSRLSCFNKIAAYITQNYPDSEYRNVFALIEPERGVQSQILPSKIPSLSDIDEFLGHVDSPMYYLIFCMAFRIALSASDIINLKLSNIQVTDQKTCIHYPPKDRFSSDRVIVLPQDIEELLKNYISTLRYVDEDGHLFYNTHKNPVSPRNLDAYFEQTLKKTNLTQKYTLRDLRSRAILDMVNASIRNDADVNAVGAYAGIKGLRLNTYVSANNLVGSTPPADLVHFQIKNSPKES